MNKEVAYWMALAHLPRWTHLKINNLIIKFYHEHKISIQNFFQLSENDWKNIYSLENKEIEDLKTAKSSLSNYAFLAETMHYEGYEFIPITSSEYSPTLKENLKSTYAPALLYVKGNKQIMKEKSIAIVGSRQASEISMKFTDNIAKLACLNYKVVVSGFAKGVDKHALDSSLNYKGQSIIVLPQGIMTFGLGFKNYYKQIINGDVLVLSTFHPKAPWKAELAMARNPIIYGLADEIYVAESSEKGGTWSGVIDGLRKNRKIYVRKPEISENNANDLLIQKGAIAVDMNGEVLKTQAAKISEENSLCVSDLKTNYESIIHNLLTHGTYTTHDILKKLKLSWSEKELKDYLKNQKDIEVIHKKPLRFTTKNPVSKQKTLFD